MPELPPQKQTVAVIDIGSSAIRMIIADVGGKADIKYLENLQRAVAFGKDVFTTGRISNQVIKEGMDILKNFKTLLDEYGVKRVEAIATSAIREAANRDTFIDQVFVRTGIDVEVLDGAEENRLELIAVEHALGEKFGFEKKVCLIIEAGSGSTEMIILNKGDVELTRMLPIGSMRLPEKAVAGKTDAGVVQKVLKRSIREIAQNAGREYSLNNIDTFIAVGGDMRFVCRQLVQKIEGDFAVLESKVFQAFINQVGKMTPEELVAKFGMTYSEAQMLYPSLLIYDNFMAETKAESLIVPVVSIRDGILLELAQMLSGYRRTDVSKQVIASARKIGKKYQYEEAHGLCVAGLSLKIFDALKEEHGLGSRERVILEVAALLHDIGMYISPSSHHKHSSYLIDAAEIFGLRKSDKTVVSNVVRYHRRSSPSYSHEPFMSLSKPDRAAVSKLASILRVADALDKSHQQRVRSVNLEKTQTEFTVWIPEEVGDISIEREALARKGGMFTEVFGLVLNLKQGAPRKDVS